MRSPYIPESTNAVDTFMETSGFLFILGGMLLGQWLIGNPLAGFLAGISTFGVMMLLYIRAGQKSSLEE